VAVRARQTLDSYISDLNDVLARVNRMAVERISRELATAWSRGSALYVAGNGGSAATASHWVTDLTKGTLDAPTPFRAWSLCENTSLLTALANDEGYEEVFTTQLAGLLKEGDVLVVISVSGNSPNLVRAVKLANARGAMTIGLLGWDGGLLRDAVSECLVLPGPRGEYGLIEAGHSIVCDALTRMVLASADAVDSDMELPLTPDYRRP